MDELLSDFLAETADMHGEIGSAIVAWEKNPTDHDRLDAIFRFVHTIKGSSSFLHLPRIAALAHATENQLDQLRCSDRTSDSALVTAVLAAIDRLTRICKSIGETGIEPTGDDHDIIENLLTLDSARVQTPTTARARTKEGDYHVPLTDKHAPLADKANDLVLDTVGSMAANAVGDLAIVTDDDPITQSSWRSVRVALPLLDSVMTGVTDMVLARNEFARLLRERVRDPVLISAFDSLSESVTGMRHSVSQMRMQRIGKLFAPLPRFVRDLANDLDKQVQFSMSGGEVELDREMIENIRDPLTHIIRNAIDHGLETPSERVALGKQESGSLHLAARQSGNQIEIVIRDDGRGVALDKLAEIAMAKGVLNSECLSHNERLNLIFKPGLSTTSAVNEISGRGVGMDIVKSNIERIGGVVELDNQVGHGLTIMLRVPMTLTIIPGLLVFASGQQFAIPRAVVQEILLENSDSVRIDRLGDGEFATVRGHRMALIRLEQALEGGIVQGDIADRSLILIRPMHDCCYALSVAAIHDHEELVVKSAAPVVMASGIYAGTTLPDNGRPVLLLDTAALPRVLGVDITAQYSIEQEMENTQILPKRPQLLLFRENTGLLRAMRLSVIERLYEIPERDLFVSAGSVHARINGLMFPVFSGAFSPERGSLSERAEPLCEKKQIKMLRLHDGTMTVCYPIDEVVDIVRMPATIEAARSPGLIAGTILVGDELVELIDAFWLMSQVAESQDNSAHSLPLCRIVDDRDGWAVSFLVPLLELAGYRTAFGLPVEAHDEPGDILLVTDWSAKRSRIADEVTQRVKTPIIKLRPTLSCLGTDDDSIYRYDRVALMEALETRLQSCD